jgi:hypothetical protein
VDPYPDLHISLMDPDADPDADPDYAIFVMNLQDAKKIQKIILGPNYFLKSKFNM